MKAIGARGRLSTCLAWVTQPEQVVKSKAQATEGFLGLHCAPPLQVHTGSPDYLRIGPHLETWPSMKQTSYIKLKLT